MTPTRDIRGALYGSRLVTLPHVRPEVERVRAFVAAQDHALVEVGFDHGRRLHATARLNPDWQVLGLETRELRVDEANARAASEQLGNLLAWRMDARTVLALVLADASVDVVEVLFPTPWWNPALRAKRLLLEPDFVADVARVLKPGGLLYVATDVEDYAEHIGAVLSQAAELALHDPAELATRRPECDQLSRRQWKCAREGTPVWRFVAVRTGE